jgi:hypothetical protein
MRTNSLSENVTARSHSEDLAEDGRLILECITGKQGVRL